jgi:hypothetical protein
LTARARYLIIGQKRFVIVHQGVELYDLIGLIIDPKAPVAPMSVRISDQIVSYTVKKYKNSFKIKKY